MRSSWRFLPLLALPLFWVITAAPTGTPTNLCGGITVTINGSAASQVLRGTDGRDVINGQGGDDTIVSYGGDDIVCGGEGVDVIRTASGDDEVWGDNGADDIRTASGDDVVNTSNCTGCSEAATETIQTGDGGDVVQGSSDGMWVTASLGDGSDALAGHLPIVAAMLGAGADVVNYGFTISPIALDNLANGYIIAGPGDDEVSVGTTNGGLAQVWGRAGSDYINGNWIGNSSVLLYGGLGDDSIAFGQNCFGGDYAGGSQAGDQFSGCGSTS